MATTDATVGVAPGSGLWDLGITEIAGNNLESEGREKVNDLLKEGWVLLHVYTLKYQDDGTWRERPMAILGKPARASAKKKDKPQVKLAAM